MRETRVPKDKIRDAERSRGQIVAAAAKEFAAKGCDGARIEAIAQRAGVNKQLLYHYFKSKGDLFEEILSQKIEQRTGRIRAAPKDPADYPPHHFETDLQDLDWLRFLMWEGAGADGGEVKGEEQRRLTVERYVDYLRLGQAEGRVVPDLDPRYLQLAVYALAGYPMAFPQITRMTTGHEPDSPEFRREWAGFLRLFGERFLSDTRGGEDREATDDVEQEG